MLKGLDVSLWQANNTINALYDFAIVKASEGYNIKDRSFNNHLDRAKYVGMELVGAYHYARTHEDVTQNAANFLDVITKREELGKNMLLALDLEGEDINRPGAWDWARSWLDIVYNATGIRPVLYISGSYTPKGKKILDGNYGLWVAHWGVNKPKTGVWPFWAVWQYSNSNGRLDLDYFNGTKEQYLKYCIPTK